MPDQEAVEELHKPIITKFEKEKVYSPSEGNIWVAEISNMQWICKYNKEFRFLLCAVDIYS